MAGLPELNGVYGTSSGLHGLDLTPLQMKQKNRMFLAQLAAEAEALKANTGLQSRGLDLQQRGQDLQTQEAELARTFSENLNKSRQTFDERMAAKAEAASVAAQQRAIEEQKRSQGAAHGFAREEGVLERVFRGTQAAADRALTRQELEQRNNQFEKTFGLELARHDHARVIDFKNVERQERAMAIEERLADLQVEVANRQVPLRDAQIEFTRMQTEALAMELAEAREEMADKGLDALSRDEIMEIGDTIGRGETLRPEILGKVMKSKKAASAIAGMYELSASAEAIGIAKFNRVRAGAEARQSEANARKAEAEAAKREGAGTAGNPNLSEDESGALRDLSELENKGELGNVGRARMNALTKLARLEGTDKDAVEQRQKLRAFNELTAGMEGDEMIDLSPDAFDGLMLAAAIPTLGVTLLPLLAKKGVQGLQQLAEDDKQKLIRQMADELDLWEEADE